MKSNRSRKSIVVSISLVVLMSFGSALPAQAVKIEKFKNCEAVHKKYPHGIAKVGYKNLGSSVKGKPFVHTKLYLAQPTTLDRDKDGVACEA